MGGEGNGNGDRGREGEDPLDLLPLEKFPSYATANKAHDVTVTQERDAEIQDLWFRKIADQNLKIWTTPVELVACSGCRHYGRQRQSSRRSCFLRASAARR